jgi:hypothetical protein
MALVPYGSYTPSSCGDSEGSSSRRPPFSEFIKSLEARRAEEQKQ